MPRYTLILAALLASNACFSILQSTPSERFEDLYSEVDSDPSCSRAVELFKLIDPILIEVLNHEDISETVKELENRIRQELGKQGQTWARVSVALTEIDDDHRVRTFAVVYSVWFVYADTNRLTSLRVFGAKSPGSFQVLSSMDPYIELLDKPSLKTGARLCTLKLVIRQDVKQGDTVLVNAYWTQPTGWGIGGIDWEFDTKGSELRPVKTAVYCNNFGCEDEESP